MCTVSYLPKGKGRFILTSNRDENRQRVAAQIVKQLRPDGQQLLYPKEPVAGGTWIGVSNFDKVICVLNGAFQRHERHLPYRRSRGLVALDFFTYPAAETFFDDYDFNGIEAFTMVIYDGGKLFDFRWDEQKRHIRTLPIDQPYIWASCNPV